MIKIELPDGTKIETDSADEAREVLKALPKAEEKYIPWPLPYVAPFNPLPPNLPWYDPNYPYRVTTGTTPIWTTTGLTATGSA